jgi:H+/Cl- antiporter ClcA
MDWFGHRRFQEAMQRDADLQALKAKLEGETWAPWSLWVIFFGALIAGIGGVTVFAATPRFDGESRVPVGYAWPGFAVFVLGLVIVFVARRIGRRTKASVDRDGE